MKNTNAFKMVYFSSFVKKFNHCNKSADRAIIVTDVGIFKLDAAKNKFKNMKRTVSYKEVIVFVEALQYGIDNIVFVFSQLKGISVSPGRDQLVVFHSTTNNDLVLSLSGENQPLKEDRVGEIIAHVCKKYFE